MIAWLLSCASESLDYCIGKTPRTFDPDKPSASQSKHGNQRHSDFLNFLLASSVSGLSHSD